MRGVAERWIIAPILFVTVFRAGVGGVVKVHGPFLEMPFILQLIHVVGLLAFSSHIMGCYVMGAELKREREEQIPE